MADPSISLGYLNTDKGSIPVWGYLEPNAAVSCVVSLNELYYNNHSPSDETVSYSFLNGRLDVRMVIGANNDATFYFSLYGSNNSLVSTISFSRMYVKESNPFYALGFNPETSKYGLWNIALSGYGRSTVPNGGFFPSATGGFIDTSNYSWIGEFPDAWQAIFNGSISNSTEDPYGPGGTSGTGGGTGNFDGTGDLIDVPNLPTLSAVDTGMISLYAPSVSDLHALANYLWGSLDLSNWNRILTDPLDAVLGLSIVPVSAPKGSSKNVWVGNVNTNVPMVQYASQYVEVDCGTLNVNEFWGSYLDYDPYTKAELFLPYIGARPIAVDDIMGKSVHVVYHVDILSGACVAYVSVDGTVLYNFIGQCSCSVPISGGDWTNVLNGILQISSAVGMMVATEGASIPATIGAAGATASGMVNAMRPNIEKSGAMSGMGGMMGVQTPYLILTRPRQCLPANQNAIEGYPSFITAQLGTLRGFTMVHKIELFDIGATREEYAEIEMLLAEGVIL